MNPSTKSGAGATGTGSGTSSQTTTNPEALPAQQSGSSTVGSTRDVTAEEGNEVNAPDMEAPHFDSSQCLFCNTVNSDVNDNLEHMLKTHGLFIPDKDRLVVDIETLITYFHLVIFGDFECLYCSTQRSTAQAAQQHMMGKGHCKFDLSDEDSEFRNFYDHVSSEGEDDDDDSDEASDTAELSGDDDERSKVSVKVRKPAFVQPTDTTLRLASGKLLSHRTARQSRPRHHRPETGDAEAHLEHGKYTPSSASTLSHQPTSGPNSTVQEAAHPTAMTKSEKRADFTSRQLVQLRAADRQSLMHLSTAEQRAVLATQKKQTDKGRRAERAMQRRVERMGNKTLMMHFKPDVPGPANG
ncbi:c2h2 finger domain-containing protein [Podospora appendiculata]|uniref:C2h2 finger domain-containing protein n=1 Tax=Podospora appendiculata TaxID=314037 RepID=A0AAE0WZ38_9PEZI|nr:c2h2 finger domain-containing protein [Podospora appendiculata]